MLAISVMGCKIISPSAAPIDLGPDLRISTKLRTSHPQRPKCVLLVNQNMEIDVAIGTLRIKSSFNAIAPLETSKTAPETSNTKVWLKFLPRATELRPLHNSDGSQCKHPINQITHWLLLTTLLGAWKAPHSNVGQVVTYYCSFFGHFTIP